MMLRDAPSPDTFFQAPLHRGSLWNCDESSQPTPDIQPEFPTIPVPFLQAFFVFLFFALRQLLAILASGPERNPLGISQRQCVAILLDLARDDGIGGLIFHF